MANISTWSTNAASNNAATPDGFPEGQSPSSLNDCGRTLMAAIRTQHENAQWIDYGHTPTKVDSDTFTVSGDQTSIYDAGRRIKFSGSVSGYATISSSSYSAPNTTVNLSSAAMTGTLTAVAVGAVSGTNSSLFDSGTFSFTLDGFSANPTGTMYYQKIGNLVMMHTNGVVVSGTSNADFLQTTAAAIPTNLRPSATRRATCMVRDDGFGGQHCIGMAEIATTGFLYFAKTGGGTVTVTDFFGYTTSGTKGLPATFSIIYMM